MNETHNDKFGNYFRNNNYPIVILEGLFLGLLVSYATRNRSIDTWASLDWLRILYMASSIAVCNIFTYLFISMTPIKKHPSILIFFVYPFLSAIVLSLVINFGNSITFTFGYLSSEIVFTFVGKFLLIIFLKFLLDYKYEVLRK